MTDVLNKLAANYRFDVPKDWGRINTIDMHTGGEPLRVVVSGFPELIGQTVLEKRRFLKDNHDGLRTAIMFEPRGHADMYGCVLTPPERPGSDFGIIFMHNEGYSTMCGHATIAITKLAVEMGWVEAVEPITEIGIDAPCGLIKAFAEVDSGKVPSCKFHNVPSFVTGIDREIELLGIGKITYDIAYGGAFYAYLDVDQLGLGLTPENYQQLIHYGKLLKQLITEQDANLIKHPFEDDLSFLYGIIFIGKSGSSENHSRNVCVFADGEVDRSPTGSGVSGRMAIHYKKGEVKVGETLTIESILGTTFTGKVVEEVDYGDHRAVIPEVSGTAHITGQNELFIDPSDPLSAGFLLR